MPRFGVVTTEAHLAYAGARLHTFKSSLFFHGSVGPVVRGSQACFFDDSHMLRTFVWKDADSHECSVGLEQSATVAPSPIEGAYHHASCLLSWAKRGGE